MDFRSEFVIFPNSDTGIRVGNLIAWLPASDEEPVQDANGNPVRVLEFHMQGLQSTEAYTIMIRDPEDIKSFLVGAWNRNLLVKLLVEACQDALEYLDCEYNDGDVNDPRPHWGENQELDKVHNNLRRMVALVNGEPFAPRR